MEKVLTEQDAVRPSVSRTALITGASGEIGGAIADAFAKAGFRLHLCGGKRRERLEGLARTLSGQYDVLCTARAFDVADAAAVDAAFADIASLDVVVHCAGIAHFDLLQETDASDWSRVLDTNLTGAYLILRRAVPLLLQSKDAHIIQISSVWGARGAAYESAYSASKGGLDALTRSLARELAPNRIPVNAIACGVIDTEMNRARLSAEELEALREEIPAGRFGAPEEVAALALALANAPDYLTGQIIGLDGGWQV